VKPPRLSGKTLALARAAAEQPATAAALRSILTESLGIARLRALEPSARADVPLSHRPRRANPADRELPHAGLPTPPDTGRASSARYAEAYAAGRADPREVVERALRALDELTARRPSMNLLVPRQRPELARADAEASAARHRAGQARGSLDGVPFLVKDEYDVAGLPTKLGVRVESDAPAVEDATLVARLREAGAVVLGKTVLTEWGMSPLGNNACRADDDARARMPHNAHHPGRAAGGSSTGSAVGVALGLGPIALAGDGGGSIRIPAALNGVFGIKPTFGRASRAGDGFKGSVAHCGPIGASAADLALALDAFSSSHDPRDPITAWAPAPPRGGFGSRLGAGVRGLRVGLPIGEWDAASTEVARRGRDAVRWLEREGAVVVDVSIALARDAAPIGYLTIGPESLAANLHHWNDARHRARLNDDLRISFAVLSGITAAEHIDAQRLRVALRDQVEVALRQVDVLALPTTAITAPLYEEADETRAFSDPMALDGMCRFAFLGNLTGVPAGTAPVGVDGEGLPIGLQIVGDAWDEAVVLGVLAHLERGGLTTIPRPAASVDLLGSS
jgi:aspartyl-tRNA(Asn)/glutamyl-tRNA(Gln) amidotransferase subunit A